MPHAGRVWPSDLVGTIPWSILDFPSAFISLCIQHFSVFVFFYLAIAHGRPLSARRGLYPYDGYGNKLI